MSDDITPLDSAQLVRIEAVHRGFLYQHLYATAALLRARQTGISGIVVESDEDVEIQAGDVRHYVQVKSRSRPLAIDDVEGALKRFDLIREEHLAGRRRGSPRFTVASNGLGAGTQALVFMVAEGVAGAPDQMGKALMMGMAWLINLAIAELVVRRGWPRRPVQGLSASAARSALARRNLSSPNSALPNQQGPTP